MNFAELKAELVARSHRSDLASRMVSYAATATDDINQRFGLSLVAPVVDTDTNDVLTQFPLFYVYPCMRAIYEDLNNGDNAQYYAEQFNYICSRQNINNPYTTMDQYTVDAPPVIKSEAEITYVP